MNKSYKNGLAPDATGIRFFSKYQPRVNAGDKLTLKVEQKAEHASGESISTSGSQEVHFIVEGPHERLAETDIVGRYPAPGTDSSPDEFLPHIALSRRTLPWERLRAKGNPGSTPWLALLLFKRSEIGKPTASTRVDSLKAEHATYYQKLKDQGYGDATQLDLIWIGESKLRSILPLQSELPLLCHVQQLDLRPRSNYRPPAVAAELDPMWKLDDDATVAVVIGNRLPDAGTGGGEPEEHVACLVSLEGRDDLPWPELGDRKPYGLPAAATPDGVAAAGRREIGLATSDVATQPAVVVGLGVVARPIKLVPLVVLHSWRFTPSRSGDFEQVVKAIRYTPNGGVLGFGKLPRDKSAIGTLTADGYLVLDNPAEPTGKAYYRGPLTPTGVGRDSTIALRAAPSELQNPAHPEKLDDYSYAAAFELGRLMTLADDGLLAELQGVRRQFVPPVIEEVLAIDPRPAAIAKKDWVSYPNSVDRVSLPEARADVTGIAEYKARVDVPQLVAELNGIRTGPELDRVIDIENVAIGELDARFAHVVTHAQTGRG